MTDQLLLPAPPTGQEELAQITAVLAVVAETGIMTGEQARSLVDVAPRFMAYLAKQLPETWFAATRQARVRRLVHLAEDGKLTSRKVMVAFG